MITISAFRWVPEFAQGYVKDIRVRWALAEVGLDYQEALVNAPVDREDPYRQWQPFGQVPAYRDDEVSLFESGAILLHLAKNHEQLAPQDATGQARVAAAVLAALNSIEPHVENFVLPDVFHSGEAWVEEYRPIAERRMEQRLTSLSGWLGDKDYLLGRFTVGDLVMATVLRSLDDWPLADRYPSLGAYRDRCTQRLAFQHALDAQIATYRQNQPVTG